MNLKTVKSKTTSPKKDKVPLSTNNQNIQFADNRESSVVQKKQAKIINRTPYVHQLGKGSHGKHLFFKITTVTIENTVTNQKRFVNINYVEDLGIVTTHGAVAQKTQQDADNIAAQNVVLNANEQIINVTFNHYTAKS